MPLALEASANFVILCTAGFSLLVEDTESRVTKSGRKENIINGFS